MDILYLPINLLLIASSLLERSYTPYPCISKFHRIVETFDYRLLLVVVVWAVGDFRAELPLAGVWTPWVSDSSKDPQKLQSYPSCLLTPKLPRKLLSFAHKTGGCGRKTSGADQRRKHTRRYLTGKLWRHFFARGPDDHGVYTRQSKAS